MPDELLAAIESTEPTADGELIIGLAAARDRLEARLLEALVEFIREDRHDVDGWPSPVSWLRAHVPVTDREAVVLVVRARRLAQWPELARLWFEGHLHGAQVDTVVRTVPKALIELYAEHDTEVSPVLVGLDVRDTRTAVLRWVARADAVQSPDPRDLDERPALDARLHLARTLDDRGRLDAELDPDTTTVVETALRVFERPDRDGEVRTLAERRAESLRDLARYALDHHRTGGRPGRQHPHVSAVIDLPELWAGVLWGLGIRTEADLDRFLAWRPVSVLEEGFLRHALAGTPGAGATVDGHRFTAEALTTVFGPGTTIERIVTAEGRVLDHGRAVRLVTDSLRDAMLVRDLGCRFPGCDAPAAWLDGHHVTHWDRGGPTSLANVAALCAGHHGVVHRSGWTMTCDDDGMMTITRPDATVLTSPPPRRRRPPNLVRGVACDPPSPVRAGPSSDGPISARPASANPRCGGSIGSEPTTADPMSTDDASTRPLEPIWDHERFDDQGRPVAGTRGHAAFHIAWDDTPPAERTEADALVRRRAHLLAA